VEGEHRDLRSGRTVWESRGLPALPLSSCRGTIETDIIVVGAGITGAVAADVLTETGLKVAIVDRRGPVRGSTAASTALLLVEIDTPLTTLTRRIGRKNAERAWSRSRRSVSDLERRAAGIACDWARRDALYLAGDALDAGELKKEAEARQNIGLSCEFLSEQQLRRQYGVEREAAIRSGDNAEVDPVRLTGGLLRRALARGARIHAPIEIIDVRMSPRQVTARAKNGTRFKASALVYATGYELPRGVSRADNCVVSTWAMATAPQADRLWPSRCLLWEASDRYCYARTTRDGRALIGGEDERLQDEQRRNALIGAKAATLQHKLHRLFPQLDATAEFAWAGSFGESKTGLPTIGPIRGMPRCFAVLGFGGNGITFGMIAAQVLRGYLRGPRDPDADLFDFR
jgi:glycine/D-amino acid oxidase-like deaminating enzyme